MASLSGLMKTVKTFFTGKEQSDSDAPDAAGPTKHRERKKQPLSEAEQLRRAKKDGTTEKLFHDWGLAA